MTGPLVILGLLVAVGASLWSLYHFGIYQMMGSWFEGDDKKLQKTVLITLSVVGIACFAQFIALPWAAGAFGTGESVTALLVYIPAIFITGAIVVGILNKERNLLVVPWKIAALATFLCFYIFALPDVFGWWNDSEAVATQSAPTPPPIIRKNADAGSCDYFAPPRAKCEEVVIPIGNTQKVPLRCLTTAPCRVETRLQAGCMVYQAVGASGNVLASKETRLINAIPGDLNPPGIATARLVACENTDSAAIILVANWVK